MQWSNAAFLLLCLLVGAPRRQATAVPAALAPVTLYLTSDDGPAEGSESLQYLADSLNVKFNVFLIGSRVLRNDRSLALFRRYQTDSLFLVCNHSFSHAWGHYRDYYEDAAGVLWDFDFNGFLLHPPHAIARMPGRNYWRVGDRRADDIVNGREAADSLAAHGYTVFGWDLEWTYDPNASDSSPRGRQMLLRVLRMARAHACFTPPHVVLLFHDPEFEYAGFRADFAEFVRLAKDSARCRIAFLTEYPVMRALHRAPDLARDPGR
ncbi:MAG TPA: polysaccharide deacetylase family protein [Puia sp.]|nr:polysaccharide deacetylase family protein [Puia sp.]